MEQPRQKRLNQSITFPLIKDSKMFCNNKTMPQTDCSANHDPLCEKSKIKEDMQKNEKH